MSKYIIMESSASVRGYSGYRNVAVVELDDDFVGVPKMISEHANGVKRIIAMWTKVYKGKTERCEYARVTHEANELLEYLNAQ